MPPSRPCSNLSARRIKLVVEYDGTDFCGWAAQPDQRTVHCTLKNAVCLVSGHETEITGASRTDSGAHARGQVVHFDTSNPMPDAHWVRALNDRLPLDIAIKQAQEVRAHFHARFSVHHRHYRYQIAVGRRTPENSRRAYNTHVELDVSTMQRAGNALIGSHDFWCYSEEVPISANAIRELFALKVTRLGNTVRIDITGNAFMRGMMRRIAGGLYEVGAGKRDPGDLAKLLDLSMRDAIYRPQVLPARGLCLERIRYKRHYKDFRDEALASD